MTHKSSKFEKKQHLSLQSFFLTRLKLICAPPGNQNATLDNHIFFNKIKNSLRILYAEIEKL